MIIRPKHQERRSRRGATIVETVAITNLLLLMVLGMFEYGRIVMLRQALQNAAREGARLAAVGTASTSTSKVTTAQIQSTVISYLTGQNVPSITVSVYQVNPSTGANIGAWDQTPYGGAIAVQVNVSYKPCVPITFGIVPNPFSMKAVSIMRSEAN
jgi:Flp pilus assembly protein TadG